MAHNLVDPRTGLWTRLLLTAPRFRPVRTTPPAGWYLALKFWGDGRSFNGPGNLAFDSGGRVWADTNATWSRNPQGVCPGQDVFRLDPYGPGPVETFSGGGLNGSGFGTALDPQQRVWTTNFGFTAASGPETQHSDPPSNSVSVFDPPGHPLSPDTGFTQVPFSFDVALSSGSSVFAPPTTETRSKGSTRTAHRCPGIPSATSPHRAPDNGTRYHGSMARVAADGTVTRFDGAGMTVPWGIAVDGDDTIWVANFAGSRLSHLCGARVETCPTGHAGDPISPAQTGYAFDGLQRNTGVQVDGSGNVWVANNWKTVPLPADPYGGGLVAFLGLAAPVSVPLIGTPR